MNTMNTGITNFIQEGKWVKLDGWRGVEEARVEILEGVKRYEEHEHPKPMF